MMCLESFHIAFKNAVSTLTVEIFSQMVLRVEIHTDDYQKRKQKKKLTAINFQWRTIYPMNGKMHPRN